MTHKRSSVFTFVLAALLVFTAGYFSANFVDAATTKRPDLNKFWEASKILTDHYPFKEKVPSLSKQVDGAIRGLVASYGDPYTVYLSKDELQNLKDDVAGSFSGIGVEIGMKDGLLTVIAPIKGSPAERAGFLPGDVIYKVDGKDVSNVGVDEIVQKIRGPKGTKVDITVLRKDAPGPIVLSPVRDTISAPNTEVSKVNGVTVIGLHTFTRDSIMQMYDALSNVQKNKESGIVLDLRNDPGGLLDSAVEMASMILPKNAAIVRERPGQDGPAETVYRSKGYGVLGDQTKIVILLDGGSASASEILAGALHDHSRATLMGSKSFGKGSVQELIDMKDGSGIKVTVAKWYTPNNVSISEKGIVPDREVVDSNLTDTTDEVLNAAITFLQTGK